VHPATNRVIVRLAAAKGAFTALAVARANGGRDVVLTLTPRPVATTSNNGGGSSSSGGGSSSSGGGTSTTPSGGGGGGTTKPPSTGGGGGGLGNY
jgi:hypothetical protein